MGNGSVQSGDGYKYRARGLIQLTGKSNYQHFQNYYNEKYEEDIDIMNYPDIVKNNSEVAIISAMWYFQNRVINKTLLASGFDEPVREITKKVNGGLNGLSDRIDFHNTCIINIDCITN
jgi:putative chitinase